MTQNEFHKKWFYKKVNVSVNRGGRKGVIYLITSCEIYDQPQIGRSILEGETELIGEMTFLAPDYSPENAEWFTLHLSKSDLEKLDKIVRVAQ